VILMQSASYSCNLGKGESSAAASYGQNVRSPTATIPEAPRPPSARWPGAVHRALPALVKAAQALRVCGVEVAARLVGDLVHGGVVGGATLAHLLDLLVAFAGEPVAVGLTHLLGGIGLGIAAVVGERAVEEAVVAVDLVAAVLGGPLGGDVDRVRSGGMKRAIVSSCRARRAPSPRS
jgi:hypothetical protein